MSRKYEISVWNDIYDETVGHFVEEKLITIGSDTMTSFARARSPQLVNNINGTNTFTFTLYYSYIDPETGEQVKNPYVDYLPNERKVKVFWKDKWYDLLIKDRKEDSSAHTFTYTCQDQYLTELSRTGFELEFNTELENNIGTAPELITKVLEGSDWQLLEGDTIYQKMEEPVYEVETSREFIAQKNPSMESITISAGLPILVYYSSAPDIDNLSDSIQFYYSGSNTWQQDVNDMLVINGECCSLKVDWVKDEANASASATLDGNILFTIQFNNGLSTKYRAERYVQSQKTIYNSILDRYVNVYNEEELLGYQTTEYNDANAVVNLVTNPSNYSNTSGWIGQELVFTLYPSFDQSTDITTYKATSYLKFPSNNTYLFNTGLQNNRSYIKDGFITGETYIFRIKARENTGTSPSDKILNYGAFTPIICGRTIDYTPTSETYFEIDADKSKVDGDWLEYHMTCIRSRSYDSFTSALSPFGIFIKKNSEDTYWLEEVQFYKEIYGNTGYGTEEVRIDPGAMNLQSIAQPVWKYFSADQPSEITPETLEYTYTSLNEWDQAIPVYNNFEKYGTIEASNSNRFNILQTIAETFQGWLRFIINHDEDGYILYDNTGRPQKYVQFVETVGEERGVNFIYGVDLKSVSRRVDSSSISTKTIVLQNENEFGNHGFCSIARSTQNYPRENFIYNFDYFVQQGLLDGNALNNDLYNTSGLAYYSNLHRLNTEYTKNLEDLVQKKQELTRQQATATVYSQYISSASEELGDIESDIIKLAGATSMAGAEAYIKQHLDYTKVTTLLDDRSSVKTSINNYEELLTKINLSITALQEEVDRLTTRQNAIIRELLERNKAFYQKYSRYIQEGTWNSEDYYDDDKYYLDALQVAYTSSRPKITYTIEVLRLSDLEEYSSKVFNLGDICTIQDTEYFGYLPDRITPYKEEIVITEVTSYFEQPEKDTLKVQNYKTEFDDLFQRITAATQNLEFSSGKYARAANIVNSDGTIKSSVIQNTFNSNKDLVYGAQNESAVMDNTGITVTSYDDGSKQVKVTSGGVFITNDGGTTWKNAIRGDGITADVLTAGKINTESITVYNGEYPGFLWDGTGINAYKFNDTGAVDLTSFVRFDQFGLYGVKNTGTTFKPTSEEEIYDNANFGLTWNRFFLKNGDDTGSVEISSESDISIKTKTQTEQGEEIINRIQIGRLGSSEEGTNYGILIRNNEGNTVFKSDSYATEIAGWTIDQNALVSQMDQQSGSNIQIKADGSIGCYGHEALSVNEDCYPVQILNPFTARSIKNDQNVDFTQGQTIYIFSSFIGNRTFYYSRPYNHETYYDTYANVANSLGVPTTPQLLTTIQFFYNGNTYELELSSWTYTQQTPTLSQTTSYQDSQGQTVYSTMYTYKFDSTAKKGNFNLFSINADLAVSDIQYPRYYPESTTRWAIDKSGDATFYDIQAKGGTIAGWRIDEDKIWSTKTGTVLSASGAASKGGQDYSIITDAINAAMGSLGGVLMSGGLINGYSIARVAAQANAAYSKAIEAWNKASGSSSSSSSAMSRANQAYDLAYSTSRQYNAHYHTLSSQRISIKLTTGGTLSGVITSGSTGRAYT